MVRDQAPDGDTAHMNRDGYEKPLHTRTHTHRRHPRLNATGKRKSSSFFSFFFFSMPVFLQSAPKRLFNGNKAVCDVRLMEMRPRAERLSTSTHNVELFCTAPWYKSDGSHSFPRSSLARVHELNGPGVRKSLSSQDH